MSIDIAFLAQCHRISMAKPMPGKFLFSTHFIKKLIWLTRPFKTFFTNDRICNALALKIQANQIMKIDPSVKKMDPQNQKLQKMRFVSTLNIFYKRQPKDIYIEISELR